MKYHVEPNTVQETLVIPLMARKVCSEKYPDLFNDEEAARICGSLDYDFSSREKLMNSTAGLFGALEVAQRQFDLLYEVKDYLKKHPKAAVVNLGCGLDDTFRKADNGLCLGYNVDFPDVIQIRKEILPDKERELSLGYDLNDYTWMDRINASEGAVFIASGVFYYLKTFRVKELLKAMSERFPGGVIAFDACNSFGAGMMRRTWLKEAGITDVKAYFSLDDENDLNFWSDRFSSVTSKSYMRGYRDIYPRLGLIHKIMVQFCDRFVNMKIIRLEFRKDRLF